MNQTFQFFLKHCQCNELTKLTYCSTSRPTCIAICYSLNQTFFLYTHNNSLVQHTMWTLKLSLILYRMGLTLHQSHGHGHSHNHESEDHSSYTATVGVESSDTSEDSEEQKLIHKKKANINVRAAFIHVIGDLVQSLGVLTAAFIIYFKVTIFSFLWFL